MKERPILFGGEMVRAILDGRKTQTRRVINPQPEWQLTAPRVVDGKWLFGSVASGYAQDVWRCPYGQPGDHLWMRETWATPGNFDHIKPSELGASHFSSTELVYRATSEHGDAYYTWRPSIFMPRWASRITLEVTGVRAERVQEISEEDAKAEGVTAWHPRDPSIVFRPEGSYRNGFHQLWDSINAKRGYAWDSNPWVWVVEFEVVG